MRALSIAVAVALLLAPLADAERPEHAGQGKGAGEPPRGHRTVPEWVEPGLRFAIRERDLFRSWYAAEYGRDKCPPGLAKKKTVCLPPGLAKKRYVIGEPLPGAIVVAPLSIDLARRLGPPPIGYRYGIVDGDLVKLALGTALVVDAVAGLRE